MAVKNAWRNWNFLSKIEVRAKLVPKETPAKMAHISPKKSYQIQLEFNNSALKKLKDALEADTSEDHSTFWRKVLS